MPSLLEIAGLTRRFGGLTAVNAVDLQVGEGELVSVIGPNGAGKTTLFNLVTGLDQPDAGQVLFDGEDITGWPATQLAERGLARTFQHGRVFANLTVLDNVLVGAHTRLRAVKPRMGGVPGVGALAELALALVQPPCGHARGESTARRGARDHRALRRAARAAHRPSRVQPLVRQPPPRGDRTRAGARSRACFCSTSPRPA